MSILGTDFFKKGQPWRCYDFFGIFWFSIEASLSQGWKLQKKKGMLKTLWLCWLVESLATTMPVKLFFFLRGGCVEQSLNSRQLVKGWISELKKNYSAIEYITPQFLIGNLTIVLECFHLVSLFSILSRFIQENIFLQQHVCRSPASWKHVPQKVKWEVEVEIPHLNLIKWIDQDSTQGKQKKVWQRFSYQ